MITFHSGFSVISKILYGIERLQGYGMPTMKKTYFCLTTIAPILFRLALHSVRI